MSLGRKNGLMSRKQQNNINNNNRFCGTIYLKVVSDKHCSSNRVYLPGMKDPENIQGTTNVHNPHHHTLSARTEYELYHWCILWSSSASCCCNGSVG